MAFRDEILDNFEFLFKDYNFKIDRYNADEELADFLVVAVGRELSLKFIKDRADFFLDISSNKTPENWITFYKVLEQLKINGHLKENIKSVNKMNNIRIYLKKYFETILQEFHASGDRR